MGVGVISSKIRDQILPAARTTRAPGTKGGLFFMCTLSSLQPSFSIFPPLFSSLVVCTYIFVPFATVGLYTGSESLFGSDTLAPRAKDRQFPLGTRLLYFDTRTRTELGVPTLLRYAATTRLNYQGMRTKQTDARAQRRHISTHNPSTPARAPIYARTSLFSLSIISPFSHLQQTFARSLSLNYSTQQFPPPIRSWKHSAIGTTPSMPSIDNVDMIIVTMAVENK